MEKGLLGAGSQIPMGPDSPMDTDQLQRMLTNGPSQVESTTRPSIPPQPTLERVAPKPAPLPTAKEDSVPQSGDSSFEAGKTKEVESLKRLKALREACVLPPEKQQALLKERYGELQVVPIPYSRPDDKVKAYILRPLNRAQWRAAEENAVKLSEAKGGLSPAHLQDLVMEKIVAQSVVWPNLPEHELALQRAGLIPTLFGIVQKISWFFEPDALMDATFAL